MTLDDLRGHTSYNEKFCDFIMLTFLKSLKRLGVKQQQKYFAEKDYFEILR